MEGILNQEQANRRKRFAALRHEGAGARSLHGLVRPERLFLYFGRKEAVMRRAKLRDEFKRSQVFIDPAVNVSRMSLQVERSFRYQRVLLSRP
jgi:hypothetical protein